MSTSTWLCRLLLPALLTSLLLACKSTPVAPEASPQREQTVLVAVFFGFDSWALTPQARSTLNNVAAALRDPRLDGQRFIIQGHTDAVGRLGYNIALSQLRAAAVVDYLVLQGADRSRLSAEGFGPLRLLDPANPYGSINRRVEITTFR